MKSRDGISKQNYTKRHFEFNGFSKYNMNKIQLMPLQ